MPGFIKQTEVAALRVAIYRTIVKWEHDIAPAGPKSRVRVIELPGYRPFPSETRLEVLREISHHRRARYLLVR